MKNNFENSQANGLYVGHPSLLQLLQQTPDLTTCLGLFLTFSKLHTQYNLLFLSKTFYFDISMIIF